jgi:hypothetical protein
LIAPAAGDPRVSVERRASVFGPFTAGYGVCRFLGSTAIGILQDLSVPAAIILRQVKKGVRPPVDFKRMDSISYRQNKVMEFTL